MGKETKYYAVLYDGSYVEKNKITDISKLPHYDFIIKKEFHHEYITSYGNKYDWDKYTCIDDNENECFIKIGNFSCLDISPEQGSWQYTGMTCKIFDSQRKTFHDLKITTLGIDFLRVELLPKLKKISELGGWEQFLNAEKLIFLENENQKLKNEILELKKQLTNLQNQIDSQ